MLTWRSAPADLLTLGHRDAVDAGDGLVGHRVREDEKLKRVPIMFETAVSANPYIQFKFRAEQSGQVVLSWTDDDGSTIIGQDSITVI